MKKSIFILALGFVSLSLSAQKIAKTDPSIVAWANGVEVNRGTQSTTGENADKVVTYGKPYDAIGVAASDNLRCVSLGNGGSAIITFDRPIMNGAGYDFVVFENAFDESFLELAFVEVSSNGKDYFRFPSISTATQTDLAGSNYKNLAGVYDYNYGVGFDLDEITDNEKLDKSNIRFVRIVDVLTGVSKDSQGNVIYDAISENTYSAGFDLSGVAVINAGQPYVIADMEGLLTDANTFELPSFENYDEFIENENAFHKNYTSGGLVFPGVAVESYGYEFDFGWGLSNITDVETATATENSGTGYNNNYYASASLSGLEGEGKTYLQGYYSSYNTEEHLAVSKQDGNTFYPKGVYVCQSMASYNYPTTDPLESGWFKVVATGYDESGAVTGTSELYLIDFRTDTEGKVLGNRDDWRFLDLASLGQVSKVKFTLESNYVGEYGINIPTYLCIDNFVYSNDNKNAIAEVNDNNLNINIYPNPATEYVTISNVKDCMVRVTDLQGRMVYSNKADNDTIQINNLTSGTYIVSVVSNNNIATKKLIVK